MAQAGTRSLTPEESLAIIKKTLGQARRELIMPDGPLARVWGLVVLVGFGAMYGIRISSLGSNRLAATLVTAAVWVVVVGAGVLYSGWQGRSYYAAGAGIWSPVMGRLPLVWMIGVVLAIATGLSMGASIDGVIALIAFFVSSLYLMSGLLCFHPVEVGTGLWIGIANVAALLLTKLSFPTAAQAYPLGIAVLIGVGLIVSGFLDDRAWADVRSEAA